jgi:hypothetical protein
MKLKKEYAVLAVIIVGLVLYLVFHETDRTHYSTPELPEISAKKISKIDLTVSGVSVELTRKDDDWFIGKEAYPADSGKIKNMLDVLEKLSVTALVSESKNYVRYDLDDENKISVKAWIGTKAGREFDIGKNAPTFQHTFVRLKDDPNVYHAGGDFKNKFDYTADDLRDKTVLSFERDGINEIHLVKNGQTLIASRKTVPAAEPEAEKDKNKTDQTAPKPEQPEIAWQTAKGQSLEKSKVQRLLSSLSSLKCKRYINNKKKEDFKEPLCSIILKGAVDYSLDLFPKAAKEAKDHPARSSENDYPFELSEARVNSIFSIADELLKADTPKTPETKPAGSSQDVQKKD